MKTYEFHPAVNAALTDTTDGSMRQAGNDGELIVANAASALERLSSQPSRAVRVRVDYDCDDFARYREVTHHDGGNGVTRPSSITADALFTTDADTALLLPLADCVGAVLYDQTTGVLGLSHLGRHNLEQNGGRLSVDFMRSAFATRPSDVKVLLSAAASRAAYPLYKLENKGLHEVAIEQLMAAGILQGNITVDQRDTTTDPLLYSHSQALKGVGAIGRHAMICILKPLP